MRVLACCLLLMSCGGEDLGPLTVELQSGAGEVIRPGEVMRLSFGEEQLRGQFMEVLAVQDGEESVVFTKENGSLWIVAGDFLSRKARTELRFRVSHGGRQAESEVFFTEVDPEITALEVDNEGPLRPWERLSYRLEGRDVPGALVKVALERVANGEVLDETEIKMDRQEPEQSRDSGWRPFILGAGDALRRRLMGTHEVQLVGRFGDIEVRSEVFELEVRPIVEELELFAERERREPLSLHGRGVETREMQALLLRGSGHRLAGQPVRIEIETPVGTTELEIVPATDDFEHRFVVNDGHFESGSVDTFGFGSSVNGHEAEVFTSVRRRGLTGCGWRNASGEDYPAGKEVPAGRELQLTAGTWGYPADFMLEFDILESDGGGIFDDDDPIFAGLDEVETLSAEIVEGRATAPWTATYVGDPTLDNEVIDFNNENEFIFVAHSDPVTTCVAPLLEVSER